jgi:hypothetical protein
MLMSAPDPSLAPDDGATTNSLDALNVCFTDEENPPEEPPPPGG